MKTIKVGYKEKVKQGKLAPDVALTKLIKERVKRGESISPASLRKIGTVRWLINRQWQNGGK